LQLNGKALDKRDRLSWAMEFWRRREPTLDGRCDVAVDDRCSDGVWFRDGGRGGACSCLGRDHLGFGAGIISRAADLANAPGAGATVSCSFSEWCNDRRLHDKHHRGSTENLGEQRSASVSESGEGQVRGPDVQHAVAADEGRSTLRRRLPFRGRAAILLIERPPRAPGSATIDLHLRPSPLNGRALGVQK
jgi:hypothetical protein